MMISAVIGLQYGDQGKGKMVDYLSQKYDVSIRFNGSNNAGHSVSVGDKNYAVHLVPSGIFHDKFCLIGNECVLDPIDFCKQLQYVKDNGFDDNKISIGSRVSIICPFHKYMDGYFENKNSVKLGTTKRGVGPAYADKMYRIALRMEDAFLTREKIYQKYLNCFKQHLNVLFDVEIQDDFQKFYQALISLKDKVVDVTDYMSQFKNKNILFEGAQSTQLDLTWGEYPFVTSSSCLAQNAMLSVGTRFNFDKVYGVFKAYTTRVGTGPFITAMESDIDEKTRQIGHEYGVTTGRPRKCGWLDLVSLKRSCILNGVTDLCLIKSDVLNEYDSVKVCTDYIDQNGNALTRYPFTYEFEKIKAKYEIINGWKSLQDDSFKFFVKNIQMYTDVPIKYISFSPKRQDVFVNE